jgi:hypothetical protein
VYDDAADKVDVIDNRAKGVGYDPGYTLVEELQTKGMSSRPTLAS